LRIAIFANTAWNLHNFRSSLITKLIDNGHEVIAIAPHDESASLLPKLGCQYLPMIIDNSGKNPFCDLLLLWRCLSLFRREKVDVVLTYTSKPNIFGSLAARLSKVATVNNISGLGAIFIGNRRLVWLVKLLYRIALIRSETVFFQNRDDSRLFIDEGLVDPKKALLLPGSGVDLQRFYFTPLRVAEEKFRFLLVARMLWDKGIGEFIEAARLLRQKHKVEFFLLGSSDALNPAAIPYVKIEQWVKEGIIEYTAQVEDVRPHLIQSDCVVLPSYREGAPRSLLEAAAMGRPIITTDTAGCRDVVVDNETGLLCRVRDAIDLSEKLEIMLLLPEDQREKMGRKARERIEKVFDETIVLDRYMSVIAGLQKKIEN
jgi:glycosyltransferase involved in cell wall biosynthesis